MKKLALLGALMMVSLSAMADKGTVSMNNYDALSGAGAPVYYLSAGTQVPAGQSVFVQIVGGPVGGALTPLQDNKGNAVVISGAAYDSGYKGYMFDAGAGAIPGVADNAQAELQVQAWVGAAGSTFFGAQVSGQSAKWTQGAGSWNSAAVPPAPLGGPALNIPGAVTMQVVPEPSTLALGLLGGLLLIRRRK